MKVIDALEPGIVGCGATHTGGKKENLKVTFIFWCNEMGNALSFGRSRDSVSCFHQSSPARPAGWWPFVARRIHC
jgi:hypothetical protein